MSLMKWLLSLLLGIVVVVSLAALAMDRLDSSVPTPVASLEATLVSTSVPTISPSSTATATVTPTGTATVVPTATRTPTLVPTPFPYDTHSELARFLYVDQMSQRLNIFVFGQLYRSLPCSTGLPTDTTYTEAWTGTVGQYYGTFFSFDVYADEAWYLYPSLGLILVHSLPYTYEGDVKIYQDRELLGVAPASHGCIRLSPEDMAWLTKWNPEGVLMTISDPYLEYWQEKLATE